jgi:hypothetical protein
MPQVLSHSLSSLFCKGRHYRPISGELLWCRLFIVGSLADNAKMTAIQSARKRILYGNTVRKRPPYQGSACWFWLHTITTLFISHAVGRAGAHDTALQTQSGFLTLPALAQMRSADRIEQCPSSEA